MRFLAPLRYSTKDRLTMVNEKITDNKSYTHANGYDLAAFNISFLRAPSNVVRVIEPTNAGTVSQSSSISRAFCLYLV